MRLTGSQAGDQKGTEVSDKPLVPYTQLKLRTPPKPTDRGGLARGSSPGLTRRIVLMIVVTIALLLLVSLALKVGIENKRASR